MESRLADLEKKFAINEVTMVNLQQNTNSTIQGVQSQLVALEKKIDVVLPIVSSQEANEDEIETLNNSMNRLTELVHEYVRKQMYFAGGLACLMVVGGAVLSIGGGAIMWFINSKIEDAKEEKVLIDRRMERLENDYIKRADANAAAIEKNRDTLHRVELYLSRRGEPDRGTYTGEAKK